jgi:hypothetical protein
MKRLLTILMFISFLATTASAGFINNKVDWDGLSGSVKQGHAMGLLDMHLQPMFDDSQTTKDLIEHRKKCLLRMDITPQGLVDLVDTMYQNDVSIWSLPPTSVLIQGLHKMCGEP